MAVWRFGCGDCSYEWNLVTLGIVASVLAILAICCLFANDGNGGCICFCCCLLVIFVILIGVGFGLGLRASEKPYISSSLRKSVTINNQQCWSKCSKKESSYYWCWWVIECFDGFSITFTRTSTFLWDYCSVDSRYTRYGKVVCLVLCDSNPFKLGCLNLLLFACCDIL